MHFKCHTAYILIDYAVTLSEHGNSCLFSPFCRMTIFLNATQEWSKWVSHVPHRLFFIKTNYPKHDLQNLVERFLSFLSNAITDGQKYLFVWIIRLSYNLLYSECKTLHFNLHTNDKYFNIF